ncbi:MAG: hypothetical protein O7D30_09485, partial [Rickettsia endosymbiont of Ixodes persulcatus]|nr:hypothetical protein [Rickettsia endosymbiont of Ixodes persulcatus]
MSIHIANRFSIIRKTLRRLWLFNTNYIPSQYSISSTLVAKGFLGQNLLSEELTIWRPWCPKLASLSSFR